LNVNRASEDCEIDRPHLLAVADEVIELGSAASATGESRGGWAARVPSSATTYCRKALGQLPRNQCLCATRTSLQRNRAVASQQRPPLHRNNEPLRRNEGLLRRNYSTAT
jgi:hypothetical protein